jgi:uncharacterized membrane protein YdjX (TVP38/TMEM64 family)
MRVFLKPLSILVVVLLVPILPFLSFGSSLETAIRRSFEREAALPVVAVSVVGLLATDIFLPIPSSFVSTVGGAALGTWAGTVASWLGLTLGAMLGFALARWAGPPLARRFASEEDLSRMQRMTGKSGPLVLVLARAVPVLAEASVLLLGATGLSWRRFLPPVAAANFGVALAYSALGDLARRFEMLPMVLAVSIALPVLAAGLVRKSEVPNVE